MKWLHTSDWHLGQKLLQFDRLEEHEKALNWLLSTIETEKVDGLIVAGDVFDIGNPPNYARKLYYQFLKQLLHTPCQYVIVIGGNHDSPAMLNAPAELLEALNVFVVGAATEPIEEELIELKNAKGKLEAVVAAVPFLRDRDLQYSIAGMGGMDRVERIKEGIVHHYQAIGAAAQKYVEADVPLLVTGHLYATGAEASDKQDNIYIGNKENIKANQFPECFAYVALGHIHRPQAIGGIERVRYSGSLIPLSFSETKDEKSVTVLDFKGAALQQIQTIPVPCFRRLKTISGDLQRVKAQLRAFAERENRLLTPWVEVLVETEKLHPGLDLELQEFTAEMDLELVKIRILRKEKGLEDQTEVLNLEELDVLEVFEKKCESYGAPPDEMDELRQTFQELRNWMQEREE